MTRSANRGVKISSSFWVFSCADRWTIIVQLIGVALFCVNTENNNGWFLLQFECGDFKVKTNMLLRITKEFASNLPTIPHFWGKSDQFLQ